MFQKENDKADGADNADHKKCLFVLKTVSVRSYKSSQSNCGQHVSQRAEHEDDEDLLV